MANSLHFSTWTITIRIFHDNFRKQKIVQHADICAYNRKQTCV